MATLIVYSPARTGDSKAYVSGASGGDQFPNDGQTVRPFQEHRGGGHRHHQQPEALRPGQRPRRNHLGRRHHRGRDRPTYSPTRFNDGSGMVQLTYSTNPPTGLTLVAVRQQPDDLMAATVKLRPQPPPRARRPAAPGRRPRPGRETDGQRRMHARSGAGVRGRGGRPLRRPHRRVRPHGSGEAVGQVVARKYTAHWIESGTKFMRPRRILGQAARKSGLRTGRGRNRRGTRGG